jgi:2-(1,2-epoxy-1,2-dihydrophenyl)acetyl-CoA isomerase
LHRIEVLEESRVYFPERSNMGYKTLILTRDKGVATVTLNRPEVLNALNTKLSEELGLAIEEVSRDAGVRVLVITGAGRGFCAGGDMKDLPISAGNMVASTEALEAWHKILLSIRRLEKPVIAAVNGVAVGAGLDLALMCDMRIASENARFGEAYVRVGGVPDSGGTYLLPRLIGTARACEMLFTGDIIDAGEAEKIGLVNKVVPADKLESATNELAARLAAGPPVSIGLIKRAVYMSTSQDIESALRYVALMTGLCLQTEDAKEGIAAFAEKRPPVFQGK